jgi:hypothetical protein
MLARTSGWGLAHDASIPWPAWFHKTRFRNGKLRGASKVYSQFSTLNAFGFLASLHAIAFLNAEPGRLLKHRQFPSKAELHSQAKIVYLIADLYSSQAVETKDSLYPPKIAVQLQCAGPRYPLYVRRVLVVR